LAATIFVPSAEHAIEDHWFVGAVHKFQVAPWLVEIKIPPGTGLVEKKLLFEKVQAANSLAPSAELATEDHMLVGALVKVQLTPESLDTKIGAGIRCGP
jgi:hypothetical protein